jgi:putative acetyltransferase
MPLVIAPMKPQDRYRFGEIWIPWLQEMTGRAPEPEDLAVMDDPATYYRNTGGDACLARVDGPIVGTVALKGLGASGFEFCKLVVTEAARGHGVGRALVNACLDASTAAGGNALWLQSFRKLEVALSLYRRMGFHDAPPPPQMSVLARTEVIMRKPATAAI